MSCTTLPNRNNFDLLRLLFATTVFVTHLWELSGNVALRHIPVMLRFFFLDSGRAVHGFFVISGFLIFMSYDRSRTLLSYFEKRVRRLYPGFAANILLTAIVLAILSNIPLLDYFSAPAFRRFVEFNLVFLHWKQWSLPGVFVDHRSTAVNGALWTLQIEVLFYLCVPAFAMFGKKLVRMPILFVLYALSATYLSWAVKHGDLDMAKHFPAELCYFLGGAIVYSAYDAVSRHRFVLLALAVGCAIAGMYVPLEPLEPLALAMIVIFGACFLPFLGNASRFGDLSYALYIYHFPIIQVLLVFIPPDRTLTLLLSAVFLVPSAAILSWHLVEKRFLLQSSHYLQSKTDGENHSRRQG